MEKMVGAHDARTAGERAEFTEELLSALQALVSDCDDYVRINNLHAADGGPATTQAMRQARAAIARARTGDKTPTPKSGPSIQYWNGQTWSVLNNGGAFGFREVISSPKPMRAAIKLDELIKLAESLAMALGIREPGHPLVQEAQRLGLVLVFACGPEDVATNSIAPSGADRS